MNSGMQTPKGGSKKQVMCSCCVWILCYEMPITECNPLGQAELALLI